MLKDNLIILRNVHGFSQEEIAEKIGISRQAYSKWESGATVPDIEKCTAGPFLFKSFPVFRSPDQLRCFVHGSFQVFLY